MYNKSTVEEGKMKFAEDVLVEIVAIVQKGFAEGRDVSELLRQVDVDVDYVPAGNRVQLSESYKKSRTV